MENKKEVRRKSVAGLAIPAGIFIGMGFGFLYENISAGLFIGLGFGFLLFLIILLMGK